VLPCPRCVRELTIEEQLDRAGFPAVRGDFAAWRAGDPMDAARDACLRMAAGVGSWCLVLRSSVGTGKTMLATATGRAVIEAGGTARFWCVPDLMAELRATQAEGAKLDLREFRRVYVDAADLLILDDLGAERLTAFAEEQLYAIVDHRYRNRDRLRLLVTTNVAANADEASLRVLDRLSVGEVVVRGAPSRRLEFDR
jgi:chromosomal replication initiation ATPase DnaA